MGIMESVKELEDKIFKLPRHKQPFARELCKLYRQKHRLSQMQQLDVDRLIAEADAAFEAAQNEARNRVRGGPTC